VKRRFPLRYIPLVIIIVAGFIPYRYEVGGDCRLLPLTQRGVRAQVSDEIIAINYKEGDWVKAGAVIAELSGRQVNANFGTAKSELEKAQADLDKMVSGALSEEINNAHRNVARWRSEYEFSVSDYERIQKVAEKQLASDDDVERAAKRAESAKETLNIAEGELRLLVEGTREEEVRGQLARIRSIEAQLESYRKSQELLKIRSPIDGRITTPYLQDRIGQTTALGDLVAVVQDTSELVVEIASQEQAATTVRKGMPVKVRLTALDGKLLMGTITGLPFTAEEVKEFNTDPFRTDREIYVEQSMGLGSSEAMFRLEAKLDDPPAGLVPGMTGEARVVIENGILWSALYRPIKRFFMVTVWSWLP
jgi:multidrug efflux pump subunit AcrA (membrane-fusion protein)